MAILRAFVLLILASTVLGIALVARYGGRPAALDPNSARRIEIGRGQVELWSEPYDLDKVSRSMEGPSSHQRGLKLLSSKRSELVWITSVQTDVFGVDGAKESVPKYFCHANLMRDGRDGAPGLESRILTLVPGRLGISLPDGYGIPVLSDQALDFYSMALKRDGAEEARRVRFRTRISFERDSEARGSLRPLALQALYVTDKIAAPAAGGDAKAGDPGCSEHESASKAGILERFGADRTIHWMVPPGTHEYRTPVGKQLELASDTVVLYATAHLHPFGKSLALRDTTTGKTVLTLRQTESPDGPVLEEMSILGGLPLAHDHGYELSAVYENRSAAPVDAMAILYLYVLDKSFPSPA